jgi:hypothetical protein
MTLRDEIVQCAEEAAVIAGQRAALFHGTGDAVDLLRTNKLWKKGRARLFTCSPRMAAARAFFNGRYGTPAVLVFDRDSLERQAKCPPLNRHPEHRRIAVLECLLGSALVRLDRHLLGVAYLQQIKETS